MNYLNSAKNTINSSLSRLGFFIKKKKKGKGSVQEFIAKLSKGLMLPIAMLPIAGIFLGVGQTIINNAGDNEGLKIFGSFLSTPGGAIFGALPLLFAIAIAIAFTNDAGGAALSAFVGFLVFSALQAALSEPISATNLHGQTSVIGYNLLFYKDNAIPGISVDNIPHWTVATTSTPVVGMNGMTVSTSVTNPNVPDRTLLLVRDGSKSAGLPPALFGQVAGINQLQSSVFGGILVGFIVAFLYNRYKDIRLPAIIGFFSGIRFVPIMVFMIFFPITIVFLMLWPLIGILLNLIGGALGNALGFNSFAFGYIERALVPFGLHHAFYTPLWLTSAGGSYTGTAQAVIARDDMYFGVFASSQTGTPALISWQTLINQLNAGTQFNIGATNNPNTVGGDQTLFFHLNLTLLGKEVFIYPLNNGEMTVDTAGNFNFQANNMGVKEITNSLAGKTTLFWNDLTSSFNLATGTIKGANGFAGVNVGQYLQGKYVFMITGLPAAAYAMVMAAPRENRKQAASITLSAGLTSFLTGITEPIEFTFLFLAPWLFWGVHAFFTALAFGLMNWIGLITLAAGAPGLAPHIGQTFSGGILDWIIYGAIQIQFGSNAWWSFVFGIPYAFIYYFMFYFLIKKFNIATPGRENAATKLYTKADYLAKSATAGLNLTPQKALALNVVQAYGGFDNIRNVDACITKLRIQVNNQSAVDTQRLMELGARGTTKPSAQSVYAVFGVEADLIKTSIKSLQDDIQKEPSLKAQYMAAMENAAVAEKTTTAATHSAPQGHDHPYNHERLVVYSPVTGKIVSKEMVPDETFSKDLMGQGVMILPNDGHFGAPIDGKLSLVFGTNHAYTFESPSGSQIMIHIGIDSIDLKDKNNQKVDPFKAHVQTNDTVKKGDHIADVNLTDLKLATSPITPVIILNETLGNRTVNILKKNGLVQKGEPLFEVVPKNN